MGGIIHLLPDAVANQIAAGEVIQRPASVVKELVENSIDAGATLIEIWITNAGKGSIQVTDNGSGLSETDARLAFERHATSKISDVRDLYNLHTMGFRGEALPSIVAVSQVELKTRTKDEELGTRLLIEGSKIVRQEPVACPVGANFTVRNLFFNIPARRKFLKSNQTELNNILTEFERIALANPGVSMRLHNENAVLLNLPAGNLRQRILGIFGKKLDQSLIPVQVSTELVEINGYVGIPESARKKGVQQFFFVNKRYMRHPYFSRAVMSAYERLIPEGEGIPFFIDISVDPSRIDVNIHPTKTEIKFEDEREIWQIIAATVREALGKFHSVPTIDFDTSFKPDIPPFAANKRAASPELDIDRNYNPFHPDAAPSARYGAGSSGAGWQELYEYAKATAGSGDGDPQDEAGQEAEEQSLFKDEGTFPDDGLGSDFIQFKGRFLLTSVKSGLMLIDQHRAHIRVLYDAYKRQIEGRKGMSQGILFPRTVQLSPSQASILADIKEQIKYIGFDLSPLGGGSYAINGVPTGIGGLDPAKLLQDIVDDVANEKCQHVGEEVHHRIALSLARKMAIPVGQAMSAADIQNLVGELFACETPNYTPDGKNVIVIIPQEQILRLFA